MMIKDISKIQPIYPYHDWEISEETFTIENNYRNESVFSLANGYLGMRGTFEEGYQMPPGRGLEGTFINGFYESETIRYGELAYAYPQKTQTMLNITNGKVIKLFLDDEEFSMLFGVVTEYRRTLNMQEGLLERRLVWTSPGGKKARIVIRRLISFQNNHLAVIHYEVTPLNFNGRIRFVSMLDGDVKNSTKETNSRIDYGPYDRVLLTEEKVTDGDFCALIQRTGNTRLILCCAAEHEVITQGQGSAKGITDEFKAGLEYTVSVTAGQNIQFNKYLIYATSRDYAAEELFDKVNKMAKEARNAGFEAFRSGQREYLHKFWMRSDIEIKGDPALQQGIRFHMFHLLQSAGRDGKTSMGAKGLSGEGYEGHCFWDTEMYALPFFINNSPEIAKKLLEFRYQTLDQARDRARQLSQPRGALYPWRTINGEEASAYYPAGTAQFHINADIAFAVQKYLDATGDMNFLAQGGAEILIETARFWVDFGVYIAAKNNQFCINGVTGPDEFAVLVNNNCYTNLLARENLRNAFRATQWLKNNRPEDWDNLIEKVGLGEGEPESWQQAAARMYLPYDETMKIYPQDDSFLSKKPWDIKNTPPEKFPLLDHHHPLVVYRHQVSKQADLILALCLLSHQFTKEDIRRNFDYYETVTVHESSLSSCIFSIVAGLVGYHDKAYQYFMTTARLDLDDYHRNTQAGIHCANMAGTWMCIINGFAGMRIYQDTIGFEPYLPDGWEEYSFKVSYRGRLIKVTVCKEGTDYQLLEGSQLTIMHNGEARTVE